MTQEEAIKHAEKIISNLIGYSKRSQWRRDDVHMIASYLLSLTEDK